VNDVLDRYYQAAIALGATTVVRITADCPLVDPQVLDAAVAAFNQSQPTCDYLSNDWPNQSFPRGLDVEVLSIGCLERAWREATAPAHREHVTAYIYQNPEQFRISGLTCEENRADERWTVDTEFDFEMVDLVLNAIGNTEFGWRDISRVLDSHDDWRGLNRNVEQKRVGST
jgi:spore coat polysaccharide biosynthesis protein SpsF